MHNKTVQETLYMSIRDMICHEIDIIHEVFIICQCIISI